MEELADGSRRLVRVEMEERLQEFELMRSGKGKPKLLDALNHCKATNEWPLGVKTALSQVIEKARSIQ